MLFAFQYANAEVIKGYDYSVPSNLSMPAVGVPFVDEHYGTTITRATTPSQVTDRNFPEWVRHEYSRRPAFNTDSSRALMLSSGGWLRLYNVNLTQNTMSFVKTLSVGGSIEPNWDPNNKDVFYYLGNNGSGMKIYRYDVTNDQTSVYRDLTTRVKALFPNAESMWTKEEGRPSKDGKIWCFMIEKYNSSSQSVNHFGFISYNIQTDEIIGHLAETERPDHISASPLGNYCVPSSDGSKGTRAYNTSFTSYTQLFTKSEHSDLALDKNGKEVYVFADYSSDANEGHVVMTDMATGTKTNLVPIYGPNHSAASVHISGVAMDKPGYIVIDFDHCSENYGSQSCNPTTQWFYNKVVVAALRTDFDPSRDVYNIAHTHWGDAGYWSETQSTVNRDLTKLLFISSWGTSSEGNISSYMVDIPAGFFDGQGGGGDDGGGTLPPEDLVLSNLQVSRSPASVGVSLKSNISAQCQLSNQPGSLFENLSDPFTTIDHLSHSKTKALANSSAVTFYAVCKSDNTGIQRELAIAVPADNSTPPADPPTTGLILSSLQIVRASTYSANVSLKSNLQANCRLSTQAGVSYGALYNAFETTDHFNHSKALGLSGPGNFTFYVVCKATSSGAEKELELAIPASGSTTPPDENPPSNPPTNPAEFSVVVTSATRVSQYKANVIIQTNGAAACRLSSQSGIPFGALYDNFSASSNKLTHTKSIGLSGSKSAITMYGVCKRNSDNTTKQVTINIPKF